MLFSLVGCAQTDQKGPENSNHEEMTKEFTPEENELIKVTDQMTQLMIASDLDGLKNLLDRKFTLTHITGYLQPRAEWLKEIQTESMKYYSYKPIKREVEIDGDRAKVLQRNILDARIWGTRNNWHLQQVFELEKQNGQWIILRSVASIF